MPRKSTAATRRSAGTYIVQNPRGIPAGRHIIRFHRHADGREDAADHSTCYQQRWFEGDAFEPPDGFGLDRFLQHQPSTGATCDDEGHDNCAGPYLAEVVNDGS